jgi:multidrug efflux system outer membrane protein
MPIPASFVASGVGKPADNARTQWWRAFRDPLLDRLVDQGLRQNLDIAQAVELIAEANAGMVSAGASVLPSASATVAGSLEQQGEDPPSSSITYSGNASWLLDLFGQGENARLAARAKLEAAYFSADTARLAFLSEVINAYVDLRYYQESLALTRLNLATRRETLELTQRLLDKGAGSQLDVLQAQSALDATALLIPTLEMGFIRGVNRLATLTAQSTAELDAELQRGAPQPWPRLNVNAGVPADVIRQRPDIQSAERALLAASAEAGIAEAQLYPSLTLSGNISLTQVATGGTLGWSFGPTLNLPFLDGGVARANHQVAQSRAAQAFIAWQAAVRGAIEEAENALAAVRRDARSLEAATKLKDSATQQLELARKSYEAGQGPILDVLNAQRGLFDARGELASATQQYAKNFVILNAAIGGGSMVLTGL